MPLRTAVLSPNGSRGRGASEHGVAAVRRRDRGQSSSTSARARQRLLERRALIVGGLRRLLAFADPAQHALEQRLGDDATRTAKLWADDVAAILDELRLDRPVLVGWSYGAFVICDYVRTHGAERIAGIEFVEGAVKLGEAAFGTLIGPGFLDHFAHATADDLPTNIWAMRAFLRACVAKPMPAEEFETAPCWNIVVPAHVRAALAAG